MTTAQTSLVDDLLQTILRASHLELSYTITPAPLLAVVFTGPDVQHLIARNAELLLSLEHLATQALRLEPHQHDQVSFDAGNFKANRQRVLERSAQAAVEQVHRTGKAFRFPAMNSRERRLLHLALTPSGLTTQSEGEGPQRHLVLHPAQHAAKP